MTTLTLLLPFISSLILIACILGIIITSIYHASDKLSLDKTLGICITCGIIGVISFGVVCMTAT